MENTNTLTRKEIARILDRHYGSQVELSRRAGVKPPSVSLWLSGKNVSENIATHAQALARELQQRKTKAA
jgi:DNA transposition AAA+ family ATPase